MQRFENLLDSSKNVINSVTIIENMQFQHIFINTVCLIVQYLPFVNNTKNFGEFRIITLSITKNSRKRPWKYIFGEKNIYSRNCLKPNGCAGTYQQHFLC